MYNKDLEIFIKQLAKLPGLGPRSARRLVIHLLLNKDKIMLPIAYSIKHIANNIVRCNICGNLDVNMPCKICTDSARDKSLLCIVENVADLWSVVNNPSYNGIFHVLGGALSAIDDISPEDLRIKELLAKVKNTEITEVILALNATIDGQTTAHYLVEQLSNFDIKITAIAHGIPIGGELDYLDESTIATAIQSRHELK